MALLVKVQTAIPIHEGGQSLKPQLDPLLLLGLFSALPLSWFRQWFRAWVLKEKLMSVPSFIFM